MPKRKACSGGSVCHRPRTHQDFAKQHVGEDGGVHDIQVKVYVQKASRSNDVFQDLRKKGMQRRAQDPPSRQKLGPLRSPPPSTSGNCSVDRKSHGLHDMGGHDRLRHEDAQTPMSSPTATLISSVQLELWQLWQL